ncbi:hypothetical protein Agabi119p4_11254 [Agaricus bisporus var. burnettii]|uniref:NACHT domain-containing protein n=1 Tax=Agaricus bisporus var. burnettii TaxID=192524 RepID=A0A8H7C1Y5_AGABI|nr:hypothetical protein Agabi119p4_11254 [Agaricus bisporus var. burnettii]
MPCDRSPRSPHSSLPYPSFANNPFPHPSRRPLLPTAFSNIVSSTSYRSLALNPTSESISAPQFRTNDLALIDAQQPTLTTNAFHLQRSDEHLINQFSTTPPPSTPLSCPPLRPQGNMHVLASVPQHHGEKHEAHQSSLSDTSTIPPATLPYTTTSLLHQPAWFGRAQLTGQHHSIGLQPHPVYHTYRSQPQQGRQSSPPLSQFTRQPPQRLNQHSLPPQHGSQGMFDFAHDFVINNPVFVENSLDNFMASLLKETILGAEFDSSARNPPPRCHPGTRLRVIERCQYFILTCGRERKLQWVVGSAGVGKSAILQSVAEDKSGVLSDVITGATIFFSINGRQDGTKTILTIAYQVAVKLEPYRLFIKGEIARDPSLLQKSLSTQFKKFIVEPFITRRLLDPSSRLLIILDGLDECDDAFHQQELLGLITNFCTTYPASPVVWIVASRPEPHIMSFFSQPKIALAYEKEEILVDSNRAREDVERYLREMLKEVQLGSISLKRLSRWPSEDDFLKVAKAADGLFAYAATVVRYISDPTYGDPVSQLADVLEIIDTGTRKAVPGKDHPLARLDALYARILSKIPSDVMVNTRKLLILRFDEYWGDASFQFHCNMLGMAENVAYGATQLLSAIASVPGPAEAATHRLELFHKSFEDYLKDFDRSGFSLDINSELQQLRGQCALRVVGEAPDGINLDGLACDFFDGGIFKNGRGTGGSSISLSWPVDEHSGEGHLCQLRLDMYHESVWEVMCGFRRKDEAFQSLLCMHLLTTCFVETPCDFPNSTLRDIAFDVSRRRELLKYGMLKLVPLETLEYDEIPIPSSIRLCFRSPTLEHSNPWATSCKHERKGKWETHDQNWSTEFKTPIEHRVHRVNLRYSTWERQQCSSCFQRFTHHFKTRSPGHLVTILDVTPGWRWVELRFVDPDDGVSEWTYYFGHGEGEMNVHTSL